MTSRRGIRRSAVAHFQGCAITIICLMLSILILPPSVALGGEGEWIELPTLGAADSAEVIDPFTAEPSPDLATDNLVKEPGDDYDWRTVLPESSATDGTWKGDAGYDSSAFLQQPPLDLPKRFIWKGKSESLGYVGYVYLGDHYFVEESDYDSAESAYRHALSQWPECKLILARLDLLQIFRGDWLLAAENMQVSFEEELPTGINHEYGLKEGSPILSNRVEDVPNVPAILYRLCLSSLNQNNECNLYDPARDFLVGRLLTSVGEFEHALERLGPVALDDHAEPWNSQAASQRADLYLCTWRPEMAFTNLLRARTLAGENGKIDNRIDRLKRALALTADQGRGEEQRVTVKILNRQEQGRWVLASPRKDFTGTIRVQQGEGGSESMTHLLYRGDDYWLMTVPLGQEKPNWEIGSRVTLIGLVASR